MNRFLCRSSGFSHANPALAGEVAAQEMHRHGGDAFEKQRNRA